VGEIVETGLVWTGQGMDRRVTMKDVADAVGVHVSTVSRALDPKTSHRIRPEVVERILRVCRELGFRHPSALPAVKAARTRTVGVVVPDILDPFYASIVHGVQQVLSEHGYLAALVNVDHGDTGAKIADMLLARGVDGLMLVSGTASASSSNIWQRSDTGMWPISRDRRRFHPARFATAPSSTTANPLVSIHPPR
jgi:DNA-binding LacI/PurR family transcriptional regulator